MIKIDLRKNTLNYEIIVKGHALFDDYGKDIVCASVSTALIMSANLIEKFGINADIKKQKRYFKLNVINSDVTKKIIENLEYTLKDLELQFPKNIKTNL